MAKKTETKKPAKDKAPRKAPKLATTNENPQPSENPTPAPALSVVTGGGDGGGGQGDTALCRKVKAHMETFRKAVTTDLHELAMECLEHASGDSGDMRPLLTFQNALPQSLKKTAFMQWAAAFGPVKWGKRDSADNAESIKKDKSAEAKPWNLEAARQHPFYSAKDMGAKPMAFADMVKKLQAENKKIEEALADPDVVRKNGETDEQLRAMHAKNLKGIVALSAVA